MIKHRTAKCIVSLSALVAVFASATVAWADIYQWEYINPGNPGLGKLQSAILCPSGAGASAAPGADWSFRNLTKAYLIGADLTGAHAEVPNLTNADLSQANLTNASFTYYENELGGGFADLTAANLTQANLTNANLSLARLTGANLSQAKLTNTHLDEAILTGANLSGADVRGANFLKVTYGTGITAAQLQSTASYLAHDLTGIVLAGNNLAGVDLSDQNLTNAKFYVIFVGATNLAGASLNQANLINADFSQATLTGADLTDADVRRAKFLGTGITAAQLYSTASYKAHDLNGIKLGGNYAGVNLVNQNLSYAGFHGVTLANSNLSQANLTYADFSVSYDPNLGGPVNLTGATFSGATLFGSNFSGYSEVFYTEEGQVVLVVPGANLTNAQLSGADARGANFQFATLVAANLSGANLTNASFSGVDYLQNVAPGANLTNANLSGADTRGANFQNATLSGANTSNLIRANGHIAGLDLTSGTSLVVRDYDGNPAVSAIVVDQHVTLNGTGTLRLEFDADPWDSTISFTPGIPVALGGKLELAFVPEVDAAGQSGRTIDLFNWNGVSPTGAFTVESPYGWDLSRLYTTGEVTLVSVAPLPGDYNVDGTVNTADYTVWRNNLGTNFDLNGNGDETGDSMDFVDEADYTWWKQHYGDSILGPGGGGLAQSRVPEPTTLTLSLVIAMTLLNRRRAATP